MDSLVSDIRHGLRRVVSAPGFTTIAMLTLALGIGANVAIFTVVNAVLIRPLPFPNPDRLVRVAAEVIGRKVLMDTVRLGVGPVDRCRPGGVLHAAASRDEGRSADRAED